MTTSDNNQKTDVRGAIILSVILIVLAIVLQFFYLGKEHTSGILYYIIDAVLFGGIIYCCYKDYQESTQGGADMSVIFIGFGCLIAMFIWFWWQSQTGMA